MGMGLRGNDLRGRGWTVRSYKYIAASRLNGYGACGGFGWTRGIWGLVLGGLFIF